jgi:hypothetical protein
VGHADVFISYSTRDKPVADAACAAMECRGIRCWIAPRDIMPSQDWSGAIIDAITDCRIFVLILSGASNESEQVKREIEYAVSDAKPILPMRIEDIALSKHMRYFIGTPHWLDALTPPLKQHLVRMVDTVLSLLGSLSKSSSDASPMAPEPITAAEPSEPAKTWNPEMLTQVTALLARFVGPISASLVRQATASAQNCEDLIRHLADSALPSEEREQFLERCAALPRHARAGSAIGASPFGTEPTHAASPAPAPPPVAPGPAETISPEMVTAAAEALAFSMGPLACLLAKRAAKKAANRREFFESLAENLSSPAEKSEFLRRVGITAPFSKN